MTKTDHRTARDEPEIVRYGSAEPQFIELWAPSAQTPTQTQTPTQIQALAPRGYAILIHGGYWRSQWDLTLMHALAQDLVARGWAVANLEYRSVGNGGGWPVTLEDVHAGIRCAKEQRPPWCAAGAVVAVGHSAGGQLALLSAGLVDAVVGLAPVTDLRRVDEEELDDNAALNFMGGHYAHMQDAYHLASPIRQLPLERPILVVHGDVDVWVPVGHSEAFVRAAAEAGDALEFQPSPGLDHMAAIDPLAPHWDGTVRWMERTKASLARA